MVSGSVEVITGVRIVVFGAGAVVFEVAVAVVTVAVVTVVVVYGMGFDCDRLRAIFGVLGVEPVSGRCPSNKWLMLIRGEAGEAWRLPCERCGSNQ